MEQDACLGCFNRFGCGSLETTERRSGKGAVTGFWAGWGGSRGDKKGLLGYITGVNLDMSPKETQRG